MKLRNGLTDYKKYIETLPCLISGGVTEGHHLVSIGMGRDRKLSRWEDYTRIPLSREYHSELHQIGLAQFEKKYQVNLYKEALIILAKWIFNEEDNGIK